MRRPHPFDGLAATYDTDFTDRALGRRLRDRVWARLGSAFGPGDRVLDLGCGTGDDAVWLATRGTAVVGVDASSAMLDAARRKADLAGVADRVTFVPADLSRDELPTGPFDGAYSDFGALNCVRDRRALAAALAARVRTGARVVLVPMGPFCLWEIVAYLVSGRPRKAFRRLRRDATAELVGRATAGDGHGMGGGRGGSGIDAAAPTGGGRTTSTLAAAGAGQPLDVWYPTPRRLRSELRPWFRPVETAAVGALLPPSQFAGLAERWPRAFAAVDALDRRLERLPPFASLADHYLIVFERR